MLEGSQLTSSKWIFYPEGFESERDITFRVFEAILLCIDYRQMGQKPQKCDHLTIHSNASFISKGEENRNFNPPFSKILCYYRLGILRIKPLIQEIIWKFVLGENEFGNWFFFFFLLEAIWCHTAIRTPTQNFIPQKFLCWALQFFP